MIYDAIIDNWAYIIFYITLWVFHNARKSKLLTLMKKNSYV